MARVKRAASRPTLDGRGTTRQRLEDPRAAARVFRDADAEWAEPGCSLCLAMNGDKVPPGGYAVSTSNRNFRERRARLSHVLGQSAHRSRRVDRPHHRSKRPHRLTMQPSRRPLNVVRSTILDQLLERETAISNCEEASR